ncbi:hypothetical protein [Paractinoplanes ferrugineus]|uniref:hypothetical protein n=1 Tax=Paractinoplanes ferrugineus TaxID=113564 RepID=UPI0019450423|nr:hypothetical protein [Actinoplanes ferrugineus]
MTTEQGLEPVAGYTNCTVDRTDPEATTATCVIDQELRPGAAATISTTTNPLLVKVQEDAGGPHVYAVAVTAVGVPDGQATTTPGPKLALRPVAPIPRGPGGAARFGVTVGASATTLDAVGAEISGGIGDTTDLRVGLRNAGRTATVPGTSPTALVTMPAGVEVTRVADGCTADTGGYLCTVTQRLRPTQPALFDFGVRIIGNARTTGTVTISTGSPRPTRPADAGAPTAGPANRGVASDSAAISWMTPVGETSTAPIAGALAGAALLLLGGGIFLARRRGAGRQDLRATAP